MAGLLSWVGAGWLCVGRACLPTMAFDQTPAAVQSIKQIEAVRPGQSRDKCVVPIDGGTNRAEGTLQQETKLDRDRRNKYHGAREQTGESPDRRSNASTSLLSRFDVMQEGPHGAILKLARLSRSGSGQSKRRIPQNMARSAPLHEPLMMTIPALSAQELIFPIWASWARKPPRRLKL